MTASPLHSALTCVIIEPSPQHCEFSGTAGSLPEVIAYSRKEVSTENDLWCGGQEAKDDRHIKRRLLNQREHEKWEDNVGDNLLRLNFMRPS